MAEPKKDALNPQEMNIYQKLAAIRRTVAVFKKDKSGYNYKYTSAPEILARVTAGMDRYHLSLIPRIVPESEAVTPYFYKNAKEKDVYEVIVNARMFYRWLNDDNPAEYIDVPWLMVGQQADAAQAMGSGLTYANRYFLLQYFQISTVEDDPDSWRGKKDKAMKAEEEEAARKAAAELKEAVAAVTAAAKDKIAAGADRNAVYAVIAGATGGNKNPNSITDVNLAHKVVAEIEKMEVKKNA